MVKKLLIEKNIAEYENVQEISKKFDALNIEYIDSLDELIRENKYVSEKALVLAEQKGSFISKCPGTQGHICCNYFVVHNGINCIYDCSYCFLKFYVNNPYITSYVNHAKLFAEIDELLEARNGRVTRVGTGEYTDSLALDHLTGEFFAFYDYIKKRKNLIVEFKTKSNMIENVLKKDPVDNIVISWSLNPQSFIDSDELLATSLKERLSAAKKVAEHGFNVAFHFDPIIYYDGWEFDYEQVVNLIFDYVDSSKISWISMGTLRYHKSLKNVILSRQPVSNIIFSETTFGKDNKVRYFKPLRVKIYRKMLGFFEDKIEKSKVYLCMELPDVWQKVYGYYPDYADKCNNLFYR